MFFDGREEETKTAAIPRNSYENPFEIDKYNKFMRMRLLSNRQYTQSEARSRQTPKNQFQIRHIPLNVQKSKRYVAKIANLNNG